MIPIGTRVKVVGAMCGQVVGRELLPNNGVAYYVNLETHDGARWVKRFHSSLVVQLGRLALPVPGMSNVVAFPRRLRVVAGSGHSPDAA